MDKPLLPLVSICCTTYNHEDFIEDAIKGFLRQKTTFPFEILIYDDASTDRTPEIIQTYQQKYPNLFFAIYQDENQYSKKEGSIMGRFVLPKTKAKYLALCEGDDYWVDPLKLQKQFDFMENNHHYSYCGHFSYNLENELLKEINIPAEDILLETIFNKNILTTSSLFFKRGALLPLPCFFNEFTIGDWIFQMIALKRGEAHIIPEFMSIYRLHPNSIWSSLDGDEMCERGVYNLKLSKKLFSDKKIHRIIDKSIKNRRMTFGVNTESNLKKRIVCQIKSRIKKLIGI